jgi:hypothetical protein
MPGMRELREVAGNNDFDGRVLFFKNRETPVMVPP